MPKKFGRFSATDFLAARDKLFSELVLLHNAWDQYNFLYTNGERVAVLNACAAWFFSMTQRMLMREMILGISRLTDRPAIGPFDNLTIAGLLRDPALKGQVNVRARIRRRVLRATRLAEPIRIHRNKYIAHLDRAFAIGRPVVPVPRFPLATVGKVLVALEAAYNEHGRRILNTDTSFELNSLSAAQALFRILEGSERWRQWQAMQAENPSS